LLRIQPSPVVQLNRAVAIAMRDGPEAGLAHEKALALTQQERQFLQERIRGLK
jgi:predicted RNA polymerase sigma factor